jgi:hypothetical protein
MCLAHFSVHIASDYDEDYAAATCLMYGLEAC